MKVPTNKTTASDPGPIARAAIALELTRNQETELALNVVKKIHQSADERGELMTSYLDETKKWVKDMKEIASS